MTGSNAIQFVGKCLTLGKYPNRVEQIQHEIKTGGFSWEAVVYAASNQFVLPAWHIKMEGAGLLDEMPEELKIHVGEITNLNRRRNQLIIDQANQIAGLLNAKGISPVFLKGTAHLLLGLYADIGERMIGDIDFLVRDNEILQAAESVKSLGFEPLTKYNAQLHSEMKHFPRMVNYDYPAAVEIHREVMNPPNHKYLGAANILDHPMAIGGNRGIYVPDYKNLLIHNMVNVQINDKSYSNATVHLRQSYDLFLLAEKENPEIVFSEYGLFSKAAKAWIATSSQLLGNPPTLAHRKNRALKSYTHWYFFLLRHYRIAAFYRDIKYILWRLGRYIAIPVQAVFNPVARTGVIIRLTDKSWYGKHIESYKKHFNPNAGNTN